MLSETRLHFEGGACGGSAATRAINCAHCRTLKTLPWPCISLFSLQFTHLFHESGSRKYFQDLEMRAIDFSHRKTPYRVIFVKIKKSQNCLFFGTLCIQEKVLLRIIKEIVKNYRHLIIRTLDECIFKEFWPMDVISIDLPFT
jgi:hypothetical protein